MINLTEYDELTNYKIYLVNKSASTKNFWCFLEKPEGVPNEKVYANSDTMLSVLPNYPGTNKFTIPVSYQVGVGATNKAVGLNIKIDSNIMEDAKLTDLYHAKYATAPPKQGPVLTLDQQQSSPANTIGITSNPFNQIQNENNGWYSNMSFGIKTANGFIGVTWAPSPNEDSTITPKFAFYIATGDYTSNSLADINSISSTSAKVTLDRFKNLEATVTLDSSGRFIVTPGRPDSI